MRLRIVGPAWPTLLGSDKVEELSFSVLIQLSMRFLCERTKRKRSSVSIMLIIIRVTIICFRVDLVAQYPWSEFTYANEDFSACD